MKKIFFILILSIVFVCGKEVNEQITDIYFGNGVWNDIESAKNGRNELSRKILWLVYNGDKEEFKKHHYSKRDNPENNENIVLLQYNWTGISSGPGPYNLDEYFGYFWDLVEMFDQLKREGQIPNLTLFDWLKNSQESPLREWFDKYLTSVDSANIDYMSNRYYEISFSQSVPIPNK